ncbi:hypothetical protein [Mesorhizobium sp.]|uniref:hypothetical protein n=1 Tax=Mesorhizobium sp. TaxID=1871066 RepID=UPI0025EC1C6A|nr:hypothetical protein [Mesorhizobium sp.]
MNKIEFYVPSISFEDVDFNALELMVFRTLMMRAIAPVDDRYQFLGGNIAGHQGIFVLDASPSRMLISTFLQCLDDAIPDALESHLPPQYTKVFVKFNKKVTSQTRKLRDNPYSATLIKWTINTSVGRCEARSSGRRDVRLEGL